MSDQNFSSANSTQDTKQDRLATLQRQLAVSVLILLASYLVFQISGFFADILRILGISLLLSYLFINVVDFLEKYVHSRAVAILIVYTFVISLTIVAALVVIPSMVYQVSQLVETTVDNIPGIINGLTQAMGPLEKRLHAAQIPVKAIDILSAFATSIPKPDSAMLLERASGMAVSTMTWALYAVSIFVVSFYFLLDGHRMKESIIALFPEQHHLSLQLMASDMDNSLQSFFRGQVVLGLAAGVVMLGVYLAFGVHYALLLSAFLAVWEIVPVIGPPIGFLPAIIAVAIHGMDNWMANRFVEIIVLTIVFNVLQQLKDNVVAPRYIGNVIGLHPVLIFVAIMVGARVDGILGIIFALPAACVINVLVSHLSLKSSEDRDTSQA